MILPQVSETPATSLPPFVLQEPSEAANPVSARYEYRAWFGSVPHSVERLQRSWTFTRAERRTDIYLLSPRQPLTLAKLRDGERLEVKRRLRYEGPHQVWANRRFSVFPLSSEEVERFAGLTGIEAQAPALDGRNAGNFLTSLIAVSAPIEPVAVRKSRLLFKQGDCQAEITRVQAIDFHAITLAIEAYDRSSADRAVRSLHLNSLPNMAYGEALWRGMSGDRDLRSGPPTAWVRPRRLKCEAEGAHHEAA